MTNDEIEALEKRARTEKIHKNIRVIGNRHVEWTEGVDELRVELADAIAQLRAEVDRLTRERDEALPWKMFYGDGKSLGEIAAHFSKSIYDFSPWLTAFITAPRQVSTLREALGITFNDAASEAFDNCILQARAEAFEEAAKRIEEIPKGVVSDVFLAGLAGAIRALAK